MTAKTQNRVSSRSPEPWTALYLDMLAAERGAGRNTLEAYRRDLDDLGDYLTTKRKTIAAATTADLRAYLATLERRDFKASSVARRLSAIRQLYRFLYAEGHRGDDPAGVLEGPRRGRTLPKILSVAAVAIQKEAARAAISAEGAKPSERLRAARLNCLLEVLYATGLRVSELMTLPTSAARRS